MAVSSVYQREIVEANCFLRQPYFDQVVDKIIANIVDGDW